MTDTLATFETLKLRREVDEDGTVLYYNSEGKLHRETGPAAVYDDGLQQYWLNGKIHRDDGPAMIWPDGRQQYWINDVLQK